MMKKMVAFFLLTGIGCFFLSFNTYRDNSRPAKLRTIIIDPGHGGLDPGTHGLISKEKDVALDISLKLGDAIQKEFPEIKIVYTRTTDILPGNAATLNEGLVNRANIANSAKGDLFICIHCNATRQPAGGYYAKRVIGHKKAIRYVKKKKKLVTVPIYESYWVKNTRIGT
jgi:N-acetylmuramoyl-L-alanine amidase